MMDKVYRLLWQLGISSNYIGFHPTADAIYLCMKDQRRLLLITKRLYPELAQKYGTSWKTVERNIRTVSEIAWKKNRPLLEQIAGISLPQRPNVSYFLAILSWYLLHEPAAV